MTFRQHQDLFLGITLATVVLAGAICLIGWSQFEDDRDNHRTTQEESK